MASSNAVTTAYLLGNLHCPSCVALIKSLLRDAFGDKIVWVSPNLVTSIVTVEHGDHSPDFVRAMGKALENVGFEICGVDTTATGAEELNSNPRGDMSDGGGLFDGWSSLWAQKQPAPVPEATKAAHLENCEACRAHAPHDEGDGGSVVEQKPKSSFSSTSLGKDPIIDTVPLDGVVTGDGSQPPSWRATMSVGGMTCAACVTAITDELQKLPWVSRVAVNLVGNSATIDFVGLDKERDLVEAIEDIGYDAAVDRVVNLNEKRVSSDERHVQVRIDGIFCPRCPQRISQTLKTFGGHGVQMLALPTMEQPVLTLRYIPNAPQFTVRHILRSIEATDPSLRARIYHPPTLEERSRAIRAKHTRQLFYREILTLVLAIPTFVLGIVYMSLVPDSNAAKHYLMKPWVSGLSRVEVILCLLATPVYFFAADVFHVRAIKELRTLWRHSSRTPLLQRFYKFGSMNMLMSLGTSIAYWSSVGQMIAAGAGGGADIPEDRFYFDSVVFLTLFLLAGRLIEAYSKSKAGNAVEALAKLRPTTALLVEQDRLNGQTTTPVDTDQLEHGDVIRVPHGSSPPVDGLIVDGEAAFDESSLTGESRPIQKRKGDEVFAGTVNKGSAVVVKVTGTSGKSMLDQIVEVVREGQAKRAPMEQVADLMTSYFVPVVTLIAVVTWAVWMALSFTHRVSSDELNSSGGSTAFAFQFAIAVFVVACPCGLGLAAPTAIFVGGGLAAKWGILVKGGGEAFEKASRVGCVVFDKTGTLTVGGEPQITDSALFPDGPLDGLGERTLLSAMKAAEENSSHPIAKAIVAFCKTGAEQEQVALEQVEELPGKGIKASCKKLPFDIAVGNESLMRDLSAPLPANVQGLLEAWKTEAKSVALAAARLRDEGKWSVTAALSISDPIREETPPVLEALQKRGVEVWMLSGDNATTAQAVAQRVGIPAANVLAEVLPSEKAAKIRYLQASMHRSGRRAVVAMVGDGINDSPALTTADVGIAIGSGSDVAISSADFVLATSNLHSVLTLLDLSRVVFRRIKINFGWAAVYNVCAIPIAAGCLYAIKTPSGSHVKLDPVWASLAMALSSISVVLSSLSLRTKIPGLGFRNKQVV
ncbi:copper transporting p-type atpase [Trichoderma cornu-damae]|uniref:Copper transporting p-type atpase n=1 Tax=Trichoderma cornu-damae TaxID=654480 RepID=A0A9P8QIM7_9HYPO|nr:copper transporting p-type atpase [Trichoderma cornu-damae]